MKHKDKVKIARRHRTKQEIKNRTPIFQTKYWDNLKEQKKEKVKLREKRQSKP